MSNVLCGRGTCGIILLVMTITATVIYLRLNTGLFEVESAWISIQDLKLKAKCLKRSYFPSVPSEGSGIFTPVNDAGVHTYHNVCIENIGGSNTGRKLVVYDTSQQPGVRHVTGRSGKYIKHPSWILEFKSGYPPASSNLVSKEPAYFAMATCDGNIHHFWQDLYLGLYDTLKATNRLGRRPTNKLYFTSPLLKRDQNCHNVGRFRVLLHTLGILDEPIWYQFEKAATCYENAVFGYSMPGEAGEAEQYAAEALHINGDNCSAASQVVLLQRKHTRRILNVDELQAAAEQLLPGGVGVSVLSPESLPVARQLSAARCARAVVGVQGAGLQWHSFMPPATGAGLLELTWRGWPAVYTPLARAACFRAESVPCANVTVNWAAYAEHFRVPGGRVNETDRERLERRSDAVHFMDNHNVWKWADVVVDVQEFRDRLRGLLGAVGVL